MSACPDCGHRKTAVLSHMFQENGWVKRRRECTFNCGHRWYTLEIPETQVTIDKGETDDEEILPNDEPSVLETRID